MNSPDLTVLPLDSANATLEVVGGKARSLARLAAAGLPVPPGFLISTGAYKAFVEANALQESILRTVADLEPQAAAAESASARIRSMFEAAQLPNEIAASIEQAYASLGLR